MALWHRGVQVRALNRHPLYRETTVSRQGIAGCWQASMHANLLRKKAFQPQSVGIGARKHRFPFPIERNTIVSLSFPLDYESNRLPFGSYSIMIIENETN